LKLVFKMDVKERQIKEDTGRARVWLENLLQGIDENYLVVEPDYLTPRVDRNIVLPLENLDGLYEHFKKIYLDLIEDQRKDSS